MENIITEILKWLSVATVASIPGILALLSQKSREKSEKNKVNIETKKIEAEVAEKVQAIYQEMVEDIKAQSNQCKEKIEGLVITVDELKKENTFLIDNNNKLILLVEKQGEEIKKLKETIARLVSQLKSLNIKPVVDIEEKE